MKYWDIIGSSHFTKYGLKSEAMVEHSRKRGYFLTVMLDMIDGRAVVSQSPSPSNPSMPIYAIIELGELLKAKMEAGENDEPV